MMNLSNISVPTPLVPRHLWAVLLAGGDGVRLRDLTVRIAGDDRPKQFCPIVGAESLLRQTRARLDPLFSGDRQVFVVSCAHERYYTEELADAKDSLVIAQPMNRGTAVGIIVALVRSCRPILTRSWGSFPAIITTPMTSRSGPSSDRRQRAPCNSPGHSSSSEPRPSTRKLSTAGSNRASCRGTRAKPLCRVNRFWEKPALPQARALLQSGCLWNTFVTIGSAATFLELVCSEVPDVVLSVTRAMADNDLASTYARLPSVDFSRDILARQANRLLVASRFWLGMGGPR